MRTENISGIYWAEREEKRGWYSALIEEGNGIEAARVAGVGSEFVLYYVVPDRPEDGDRECYSLFERATSGSAARGATPPETVKVWHCTQTWPVSRAGLAEVMAYIVTVVSDVLSVEGMSEFYE